MDVWPERVSALPTFDVDALPDPCDVIDLYSSFGFRSIYLRPVNHQVSVMVSPKANWKGFIKLGEVSCPVALYTAASSSERIAFNTLNRKNRQPNHMAISNKGPTNRDHAVKRRLRYWREGDEKKLPAMDSLALFTCVALPTSRQALFHLSGYHVNSHSAGAPSPRQCPYPPRNPHPRSPEHRANWPYSERIGQRHPCSG